MSTSRMSVSLPETDIPAPDGPVPTVEPMFSTLLTRRRAVALGLAGRDALSGAVSIGLAPLLSAAVIRNLADPAASLGAEPPGLGPEPEIAESHPEPAETTPEDDESADSEDAPACEAYPWQVEGVPAEPPGALVLLNSR